MTVREFETKYSLHDSLVKNIRYDSKKKELHFLLDFCWWMQPGYDEDKPMPDLMELVFYNVPGYQGLQGAIDDLSILWFESGETNVTLALLDDLHDKLYPLTFFSDDIELRATD
jgi:hypothetical protein